MVGYSFEIDKSKMATAVGRELDISPKHAIELAHFLRGLNLEEAKNILNDVIAMRRAIPYRRFTRVGHRRGAGFGPGGYPVKTARKFLKLLNDVESNAGLHIDAMGEDLRIVHLSAYKGRIIQGRLPRAHGRASPHNKELVNVEIVVEKLEG